MKIQGLVVGAKREPGPSNSFSCELHIDLQSPAAGRIALPVPQEVWSAYAENSVHGPFVCEVVLHFQQQENRL